MAVAYDNSVTVQGFTINTITTGAFTIGSGNVVAFLGLYTLGSATGITCSCPAGVTSGSAIAGATVTGGSSALASGFKVIGPASGSKTAKADWTGAFSASLGVITATGVDQTTAMNNGGSTAAGASPKSIVVTSNSGDLTTTLCFDTGPDSSPTTNQTKKLADFGNIDIGPGTANPTHTWTKAADTLALIGANFIAFGGGGATAHNLSLVGAGT